jgi:protein TonB
MFSESLLDSSAGRARRGWSTLVAWMLQSSLIAFAVVLPLWHTNALPTVIATFTPIGPPPGAPAPRTDRAPAPAPTRHSAVVSENEFTTPPRIPGRVDMRPDPPRVEVAEGPPCTVCVPGGTGDPNSPGTNVLRNLIPAVAAAPPPPPTPTRVKVSVGVSQGYLVQQVQPVYPAIARTARIEGTVVLAAVINRDGTIQGLHAVSGPPMLVGAAMDAVRQWRYRPYTLNNQPVEVETQISVIFTLAR